MASRLILSLRKAAEEGLVLRWNDGHLSVDRWDDTDQEMTDLSFSHTARGARTEDTIA